MITTELCKSKHFAYDMRFTVRFIAQVYAVELEAWIIKNNDH